MALGRITWIPCMHSSASTVSLWSSNIASTQSCDDARRTSSHKNGITIDNVCLCVFQTVAPCTSVALLSHHSLPSVRSLPVSV